MTMYKRNETIDYSKYQTDGPNLETKFGLPPEVKFCKKCVISNQRPNSCAEYKHTKETKKETIHFDAEGVCDACRAGEQKYQKLMYRQVHRFHQYLK